MKWQSLFDHGREITAEEARAYIGHLPPHDLQLIDVRQPKEYHGFDQHRTCARTASRRRGT